MKKKTIKDVLILFCIFVLLIPLMLLIFGIKASYADIATKKIDEILEKTIIQKDAVMQNMMNRMVIVSNTVATEEKVWELLKKEEISELEYAKVIRTLETILSNNYDLSFKIAIFNQEKLFKTWEGDTKPEEINQALQKEIDTYDRGDRVINWFGEKSSLFSGYTKEDMQTYNLLRSVKTGNKKYYVLISIDENEIKHQLFGSEKEFEDIYYVKDENNQFVTCIYSQNNHEILKDGIEKFLEELPDNYYFKVKSSYKTYGENYTSHFVTMSKNMNQELKRINVVFYITIFIIIIVFNGLLLKFCSILSKPINNLLRQMEKAEETQEYCIIKQDTAMYEIESLITGYNKFVNSINNYISRLKEEEKEKRKIFFEMLQMQINPHFLFNTLNSIKWICYLNKDEQAGELIANLGKMYEISMNKGKSHLTVSEEKSFIESYIHLMENRYGLSVNFEFNIEDTLEKAVILKFLLQPVVENIFIHGFTGEEKQTNVKISVTAEESLYITVTDNGRGIVPEKLSELQKELKTSGADTGKIGIINVNHRIILHYGKNYGLKIKDAKEWDSGVCVTLKLPIVYEE